MKRNADWAVTSELGRLIAHVEAGMSRADSRALANGLDAIRHAATIGGVTPVLPLIYAIEAALARGERGAMIADGLSLIRDAAGCGAMDARTGRAFAAAYAVRLSG